MFRLSLTEERPDGFGRGDHAVMLRDDPRRRGAIPKPLPNQPQAEGEGSYLYPVLYRPTV